MCNCYMKEGTELGQLKYTIYMKCTKDMHKSSTYTQAP